MWGGKFVHLFFTNLIVVVLFSSVLIANVDQQVITLPSVPKEPSIIEQANHSKYTYGYNDAFYLNLSAHGSRATYFVVLIGMRNLPVVNSSDISQLLFNPIQVNIYKVNQELQPQASNSSFQISQVSLTSPQTFPLIDLMVVPLAKIGVSITEPTWSYFQQFLYYPEVHYFYLNFTITPYENVGPFVFAGVPQAVTLNWTTTVVS
jgi:hypothetical protein